MKKSFIAIAITLLAVSGFAQRLSVYSNGKKIGTATASFTVTAAGGVRSSMVLTMNSPQGNMTMKTESISDKMGVPLTESMDMTFGMKAADGKPTSMKANTSVRYSNKIANVKVTAAGKSTTKTIAAPKGANIADPSVLWFLVTKPAVGTTVTCQSFSLQKMVWEKETSKYLGLRTINVGGKQRKVHHLTSTSGSGEQKLYIDEKGQLLKADFGEIVLIAD